MKLSEFKQLYKKVARKYIPLLGIDDWTIQWSVCKDNQTFKKFFDYGEDVMGVGLFPPNKLKVHLVFILDQHKTVAQAKDTIIHELMHIAVRKLIRTDKKNKKKLADEEEQLAVNLTKAILS